MDPLLLSIQATYKTVALALLRGKDVVGTLRDTSKASATLIPYLDKLLTDYHSTLDDLRAIVVDQGPGAFTSLRVTIATVNGISFAHAIPLIGVDGLDALARETQATAGSASIIVSLLNAYNQELYYGIYRNDASLTLLEPKGYKKIDLLLGSLSSQYPHDRFVVNGNGVETIREKLTTALGERAKIASPLLEQASAATVGIIGYEKFLNNEGLCKKLLPLYLKEQSYVLRPQ